MTLPELERFYRVTRREIVRAYAKAGWTQTEAAKELGVTLTALNNIIRREEIAWPVKRQGRRKNEQR